MPQSMSISLTISILLLVTVQVSSFVPPALTSFLSMPLNFVKFENHCSSFQGRTIFSQRPSIYCSLYGPSKKYSVQPSLSALSPRFPQRAEEAVRQASESTLSALDHGHIRVNVQLRLADFDSKLRFSRKECLLIQLLNELGLALVARGFRIHFIFNTVSDVATARRMLHENIKFNSQLDVLGVCSFGSTEDIAILVCPCNEGNENLGRIEAVERLLYSGPPSSVQSKRSRQAYLQRPIVMINPSLEAIHPQSSPQWKVAPMFMSDFETAYYLDPNIVDYQAGVGQHGALLKAFPSREWQFWLRSGRIGPFQMVWSRAEKPSDTDLLAILHSRMDGRLSMEW